MTPAHITAMLDAVVRREGPFNHLAADRGGATAWGVTQGTLAAWRGTAVSEADVKALTPAEAIGIFAALFYTRPHLDQLPDLVQPFMVDFAVNSGPHLAVQALQESLGMKPDGSLGPLTVAATIATPAAGLLVQLIKWRIMMIARIVRRDPSQLMFLSGWLSRSLSFIPAAA